jgi:hypothetical protein
MTSTDAAKAITDMTVVTFYYLLRPGEYTSTATDDAAFRLQDLQLCCRPHASWWRLRPRPKSDIPESTSSNLTPNTHSNYKPTKPTNGPDPPPPRR